MGCPVVEFTTRTSAAPSGSVCPIKCKESIPTAVRLDAVSATATITAVSEVFVVLQTVWLHSQRL